MGVLAAYQITKANGTEGHEAEVQWVKVTPPFNRCVHCRGTAGDDERCYTQNQHDVVHWGLPACQAVCLRGPRAPPAVVREDPFPPQLSLMAGLHDIGYDSDQALQEQVKEQDGPCTSYKAIKYKKNFASNGGWGGHAKPWKIKQKGFFKKAISYWTEVLSQASQNRQRYWQQLLVAQPALEEMEVTPQTAICLSFTVSLQHAEGRPCKPFLQNQNETKKQEKTHRKQIRV